MSQLTEYVAGFMFNQAGTVVALIEKQRPAWQKGRWNGIGGHIEPGETPERAMVREFKEETGVYCEDWAKFCTLSGEEFVVHFFAAFSDYAVASVRTTTDERVERVALSWLDAANTMTNVPWLIQMALSMSNEKATSFIIQEAA